MARPPAAVRQGSLSSLLRTVTGAEPSPSRSRVLVPRADKDQPGRHGSSLRETRASDGDLTPLDRTLDSLGMGRYQLRLLVLCGCGWLADNMWLQTIAVILPRVQEHWAVSDRWIGALSSSIFAGMTLGAWVWGSYSDSFGRTMAFNGTLLLTAVFGLLAGWAPSFRWLCMAMFGLGCGVGGSMPTDGTLFLESIPKSKHYLLTALSFFFSLGSVITSVLGLVVIPSRSCPPAPVACDPETQNTGWRIQIRILGLLTLTMFVARFWLFHIHESAKWLVSVGRTEGAVISLKAIAKYNGDDAGVGIGLQDVVDREAAANDRGETENGYAAVPLEEGRPASPRLGSARKISFAPKPSLQSTFREEVQAYIDRVAVLFTKDMRRITILIWAIWATVSAAYTMYNTFLPVFLEHKLNAAANESHTESMRDYVIYTLAGCPGSLIGAWLVETRIGYRWSMALSTLAAALGVIIFMEISSSIAVILSSAWVSLMGTMMYAIIYGYTPAAFPVALRGSACGIASALSRIAGVMAPLVTGWQLAISADLPLVTSSVCFCIAAGCMIALP